MPDHIASELLDDLPAVLGDLIGAVGRGVADAQHALDTAAIEQLERIAQADGRVAETLRAIGYQPTWYRIPELQADLTVSLTLAGRTGHEGRTALQLYATPVDANFSNKYFVNAEVTSHISFKVVPVPPAPMATELIVVPDLRGRTWYDAAKALEAAGIAFERRQVDEGSNLTGVELADSDTVRETVPEHHELLLPGSTLEVITGRPLS